MVPRAWKNYIHTPSLWQLVKLFPGTSFLVTFQEDTFYRSFSDLLIFFGCSSNIRDKNQFILFLSAKNQKPLTYCNYRYYTPTMDIRVCTLCTLALYTYTERQGQRTLRDLYTIGQHVIFLERYHTTIKKTLVGQKESSPYLFPSNRFLAIFYARCLAC